MKALIVDDSRALRSYVRRILEQMGIACTEACDGREALEHLDGSEAYDFALIDYNMPVLNGPGLLKEIGTRARLAPMKRIMVTSMTDAEFVQEALDLGAHDYLMKPFYADGLAEKLQLVGINA